MEREQGMMKGANEVCDDILLLSNSILDGSLRAFCPVPATFVMTPIATEIFHLQRGQHSHPSPTPKRTRINLLITFLNRCSHPAPSPRSRRPNPLCKLMPPWKAGGLVLKRATQPPATIMKRQSMRSDFADRHGKRLYPRPQPEDHNRGSRTMLECFCNSSGRSLDFLAISPNSSILCFLDVFSSEILAPAAHACMYLYNNDLFLSSTCC